MSLNTLHLESLLGIIRDACKPMLPLAAPVASSLQQLQDIRAVVFDVYGTLFLSSVGDISLAVEANRDPAFRKVLEAEGITITDEESELSIRFYEVIHNHQHERKEAGIEFPEVDIRAVWHDFLNQLSAKKDDGSPLDKQTLERIALRYECLVNPVWPAPEVEQMLWKIRRKGLPLGIISNAQFYTPLLFERFFSQDLEEMGIRESDCVWSYKMLEAKPSVALYESSAKAFSHTYGIAPSEVLYVGNDMLKDIYPAKKAGFRTALYAGDKRSLRLREDDERCKGLEPDLLLIHWNQLYPCIAGS